MARIEKISVTMGVSIPVGTDSKNGPWVRPEASMVLMLDPDDVIDNVWSRAWDTVEDEIQKQLEKYGINV